MILQPDGHLAVWSTFVDKVILMDADRAEILAWFDVLAEQRRVADRLRMAEIVDTVIGGEPEKFYYQFAMSWEDAVARSTEHDPDYFERAWETL